MNRRSILLSAALGLLASPALAQPGWPGRPLRIIVPFAPGSFTDVSARLLGQELTEQLGQQVVVENRAGAGGTLGAQAVVRAAPDGLTLLLSDNSLAISPGLYPNLGFNPATDLIQISRIAESPSLLMVRTGLGPRSLADLIALARQRPGEITFGSGGQGSSAHLAMELMLGAAGIRGLHVPFRGVAAAIAEVIAGRVDMVIASLASGVAHVREGRMLGLGVTGRARSTLLPGVPTFAEAGLPAYDMNYWWGIAAPAGTPADIIARLNREIVAACQKPRLREAFAQSAAVAVTSTPEEMQRHLVEEIAVWRDVIARGNIRPEA